MIEEREQHVLLIPPTGLMEVLHTMKPVDAASTLGLRGSEGQLVSLDLRVEDEHRGRVIWYVNQTGPVNERARLAVAMLTGAHMILTGHVMFFDVDADRVFEIVAELSRKE